MSHRKTNIVAVTGGLWTPSKTTVLTQAIAREVSELLDGVVKLVQLGPIAAEIGTTLTRDAAPLSLEEALHSVENADVLVAVTPVFRGTFSGHFKHFFDLVTLDALRGVPVIVGASGGGDKHCLVLEYALRPLFGFFQAFTVPTGIYANERDFDGGQLNNPLVTSRIHAAASEVATLLGRSTARAREDVRGGLNPSPLPSQPERLQLLLTEQQ